jgi:hypothetical protein
MLTWTFSQKQLAKLLTSLIFVGRCDMVRHTSLGIATIPSPISSSMDLNLLRFVHFTDVRCDPHNCAGDT